MREQPSPEVCIVKSPPRARSAPRRFGDNAPALLGSVGADGRMKTLGPGWEKVLGYGERELRNRPLHELLPLRVPAAISLVKRILDTSRLGPMEFRVICKDGTHKLFVWQRRHDAEGRRMLIAGEEIV